MTSFSGGLVSPEGVNDLHALDDVDVGPLSHHHSLGIGSGQSSPGNHSHNGRDSVTLTPATAASITDWPKAELRQTSAQSIANNTWTGMNMDTEDLDNVNGHSTSSNTNRYTSQLAGWYLCGGLYAPVSNVTAIRGCRLSINGTAVPASWGMIQAITTGSSMGIHSKTKLLFLPVGTWVDAQAFQLSGGNLNTQVTNEAACSLTVIFMGTS